MDSEPIFLVGAQRSGTTVFRLMLNAHSRIAIPFETNFIPAYAARIERFGDLAETPNLHRLLEAIREEDFVRRGELARIPVNEVLARLRERTLAGVVDALFTAHADREGKVRWGDKSPGSPWIHVLADLFPRARILHLIRDGRDVAASRKRTWKERDVARLAHDWVFKVRTIRSLGVTLGDRYREVRFEALATDPRAVLREVTAAVGEEFEEGMLSWHETAREALPERSVELHHRSAVRPLDPSKVGSGRRELARGERVVFQKVAGELLEELDYEREDHGSVRFRLAGWWYERISAFRGRSVYRNPCEGLPR